METMPPSTVTPPQKMTKEDKKQERKAKLVSALSALDKRGSSSKTESTAAKTEAEAQSSANSATATPSVPTPIPAPTSTPKAPAAPKFPRKKLPVDDRFGLPLSPRFFEVTPRGPSTFGRATRM